MKKSILTLTAVALATVATPAMAGSLQGEVRFADVRNGNKPDSTEYKVEYWAPLNSGLNYGAELQVKQRNGAGALDSMASVKAGPNLPAVLGLNVAAYGELGRSFKVGNNSEFWGAGLKVGRQLYGPISVTAGYRHRQGFEATDLLNEERLHGGLAIDVGSGNAVGATYYRTRGTTNADAIGVGITHKF